MQLASPNKNIKNIDFSYRFPALQIFIVIFIKKIIIIMQKNITVKAC